MARGKVIKYVAVAEEHDIAQRNTRLLRKAFFVITDFLVLIVHFSPCRSCTGARVIKPIVNIQEFLRCHLTLTTATMDLVQLTYTKVY